MVQTRKKDDSSFSNSTDLRRSTRETRLRFEVSDKDDEDFEPRTLSSWRQGPRNHPKRSRRVRVQYDSALSRSLRTRGVDCGESDTDDDPQSDESIFRSSRRPHLSRSARRVVSRSQRMSSTDHADTSNDHIDMALGPNLDHQEDDGVRRSTRQRTHPASWIVGNHTLRGYPKYNQDEKLQSSDKGNCMSSRSRNHISNDITQHEQESTKLAGPSLRSQRLEVRDRVKQEPKEEEDDDEDNENEEGDDETEEKTAKENGEEAVEEEDGNDSTHVDENVGKRNLRRTGKRGDKDSAHLDENFPDMYSRVKRVRRQTKRFSFSPSQSRRKFGARDEDMMSHTQSSSGSDESDSDQGTVPRRRSLRPSTRTYQLRVNKPTIDRFQAHHEPARRPQRSFQKALCNTVLRHLGRRSTSRFAPDSSSSSSDSQARFDHKKNHSRHLPHNAKVAGHHHSMHSKDGKPATLADIDPMALDTSIRFDHVGGLEEHIHCLQEMVVFPMLYKDVFEKFHITPPKGVLFHGPPGTGKTLIARALANECSQGDRKVSFFMRKGADCLSKWVGESERQLRLLFEQAYQMKPSIIFFDEIDGLAPVRSSKQDQIHASIVSTLLALMDGLDNRGEVIVIGATNRIDAIDPALRRPGRFDRELYFPLPACKERQEILQIHISKWDNKPDKNVLCQLAEQSSGYCGSDLRALCSESVIQALRRTYPQIYKSTQRLLLDANKVQVECTDFVRARSSIIPAAHRVAPSPARKLPTFMEPLLKSKLESVMSQLGEIFPHGLTREKHIIASVHRPRLLIVGSSCQQGQSSHLAPALLHLMEHIPVFILDLGTLYEVSARSPEETVSQVFQEARRNPPSVIYLPGLAQWWDLVPNTVQAVFTMQLQKLDLNNPVFLLATSDVEYDKLPQELCNIFSRYRDEIFAMSNPSSQEREEFFRFLLLEKPVLPPEPPKLAEETWEELPIAPPPEPAKLTEEELKKLYEKEEHTLRELRIFLREVCAKLARNRLFFMFTKPVDVEEAPDYYDIIEKPMDLETMMTRIDKHDYVCAKEFLNDIDLICRNALEYNPDRDAADKLIRHRACFLRDTAYALIKAEMDSDFEDRCRVIAQDRKKRKDSPSRYAPAPDFLHTASSAHGRGQTTNGNKDGAPKVVNGDLSSHSSVASNNGATAENGPFGSGRKRRQSSWSRGCIKKKKKKNSELNMSQDRQDNDVCDSETPSAGPAPPLSPPVSPVNRSRTPIRSMSRQSIDQKDGSEKGGEEKMDYAVMNGSHDSTLEDNTINLSGSPQRSRPENAQKGESKSPIRDSTISKEIIQCRSGSLDCNKHESGTKTSSIQEVAISQADLEKLLAQVVESTNNCSIESLVELYVRFDKKISQLHNTSNRTSLPQVLREELSRFSTYMGTS